MGQRDGWGHILEDLLNHRTGLDPVFEGCDTTGFAFQKVEGEIGDQGGVSRGYPCKCNQANIIDSIETMGVSYIKEVGLTGFSSVLDRRAVQIVERRLQFH